MIYFEVKFRFYSRDGSSLAQGQQTNTTLVQYLIKIVIYSQMGPPPTHKVMTVIVLSSCHERECSGRTCNLAATKQLNIYSQQHALHYFILNKFKGIASCFRFGVKQAQYCFDIFEL